MSSPLIQVPAASGRRQVRSRNGRRPPFDPWGRTRDLGTCLGRATRGTCGPAWGRAAPRSRRGCRQRARRAAGTRSRPARSLARPPRWDSQPKLRSTTQRQASTTKPLADGSRATTRWRMPCRFDHAAAALGRERAVVDAPPAAWASGPRPASSASGVSRSCSEAGTTATASRWPSASTSATRSRPTVRLAGSYPRGPRTPIHFTIWVPTTPKVGPAPGRPHAGGAPPRAAGRRAGRGRASAGTNRVWSVTAARLPAGSSKPRPRVPRDRADHAPDRRRASALRRVGPPSRRRSPRPRCDQPLQARLRPRPPVPLASTTERLVPSRGAQMGTARRSRLETGSQPTASARSASSRITAAA